MTRPEIYERDHDLAPAAHRIELVGSPRQLTWPPICPNCGSPANERVAIRKVFRRSAPTDDGFKRMWKYRIQTVDIPLCARCAEAHRASAPPLTRMQVALSYMRTGVMFAFVPALVATAATVPAVLGRIGEPGFRVYAIILLAFATATVASAIVAWRETRIHRVLPLTDIARACDVSDDLGDLLTGERHVYAIRSPPFAEAFAAANASRVFDPARHARVQRVQRLKYLFGWAALLACALITFWLWLTGQS